MTKQKPLSVKALDSYPPLDDAVLEDILKKERMNSPAKTVVLDDDPTGVQTVHGVSVYTDWTAESIKKGFQEENNLFYILTNSRGFTTEQTTKAHNEIARNIRQVSNETGKPFLLISRSDSTMRGHYPLETEVLREALEDGGGDKIDGEILCFFFKEGGRVTIDDVHYVRFGDELVPVGDTEFAKDKTFGYASSNLREYVEEKTKGVYKAEDVAVISLQSLRAMDFDAVERILLSMSDFSKLVVNAVDYCDLKVFCVALYRALAKGKRFIFRTSAAFVKIVCGISDKPLLSREELVFKGSCNGGIVLVGSHVDKTTRQLEALQRGDLDIAFIEFNQHLVVEDGGLEREAKRVTKEAEACVRSERTAVVYTRREKINLATGNRNAQLKVSVRISDALSSVVGNLTVRPSFVIAKGGITSSDVGTKALRVKQALVIGQVLPGIPVWQTGPESKFPDLPFIIFPGNVGDDKALLEIIRNLQR